MNLNKAIKDLKTLLPSSTNKYRPYAEQVLNLFKDRKIEKRKEAEKLLEKEEEDKLLKLSGQEKEKTIKCLLKVLSYQV